MLKILWQSKKLLKMSNLSFVIILSNVICCKCVYFILSLMQWVYIFLIQQIYSRWFWKRLGKTVENLYKRKPIHWKDLKTFLQKETLLIMSHFCFCNYVLNPFPHTTYLQQTTLNIFIWGLRVQVKLYVSRRVRRSCKGLCIE